MKYRKGFVTNSSSCSFLIQNISDEKIKLKDIIEDWEDYITAFYNCEVDMSFRYGINSFIKSYPSVEEFKKKLRAECNRIHRKQLKPNETIFEEFSDHLDTEFGYMSILIHECTEDSEGWLDNYMKTPESNKFAIKMIESHH